MAIQELLLTCDHCFGQADDFRSIEEATEAGWWVVKGPERWLGGDGERVYCDRECMAADL